MSDIIVALLASVEPSTITDIFSGLMLLLFSLAIFSKLSNRYQDYLAFAPTLMTSLGILGTFTGIVIGLFDFNISHIDSSIALLLEGLKTAFITSILGIALSLILKLLMQCYQPKQFFIEETTMADLHSAICAQVTATQSLARVVEDNQQDFLATQQALTDVARQHQQTFLENQKELAADSRSIELKNQQEFLKNQESYLQKLDSQVANFARAGVQSLVAEMHEVVKDFNKHVQVEFGENFQQLGTCLDQFGVTLNSMGAEFEQHEERMQYWSEHCDANVLSLVRVRNELEDVNGLLSDIPKFISEFGSMMKDGQQQLITINELFDHYADISTKVSTVLPDVGNKLVAFTASTDKLQHLMTYDIQQLVESYRATLANAQEAALSPIHAWQNQIDTSLNKLTHSFQQSLTTMTEQNEGLAQQTSLVVNTLDTLATIDNKLIDKLITQSVAVHRSSMQELAVHQAKTHQEMTESLSQLIKQNYQHSEGAMGRQVENIESHMAREIEQVMRTMGEALAMISGQFTRDYQGLINQMQDRLAPESVQ